MPCICLVYADGRSSIADLPPGISEQALEERIGPVLAGVVTGCTPSASGVHTIAVPEIPTAALGAPLRHYVSHGKLKTTPPLLLAASYKAAERLDLKGLVRAVERAVMAAVAVGDVRLEELSAAFAGCPRIVSLCDNYLELPGVRPPPPFNIATHLPALVAEHGAVFVMCNRSYPGDMLDEIRIIADASRCRELSDIKICRDVCRHLEDTPPMRGSGKLIVLTLSYPYHAVDPREPSTWLQGTKHVENIKCSDKKLFSVLRNGKAMSNIALVVCSEGLMLFSVDEAAAFTFAHGGRLGFS
jgi:hypothetical protein